MANNFIDAVKEHMERLAKIQAAPQVDANAIVRAAVDTIRPLIISTVKASNTELVRVLRNNPQALAR
jgi:hypothetical protein